MNNTRFDLFTSFLGFSYLGETKRESQRKIETI